MKKPRSVKAKIAKLIRVVGDKKELAKTLNIHLTYIYKMESGMVPGKRLYRDILKLEENLNDFSNKK